MGASCPIWYSPRHSHFHCAISFLQCQDMGHLSKMLTRGMFKVFTISPWFLSCQIHLSLPRGPMHTSPSCSSQAAPPAMRAVSQLLQAADTWDRSQTSLRHSSQGHRANSEPQCQEEDITAKGAWLLYVQPKKRGWFSPVKTTKEASLYRADWEGGASLLCPLCITVPSYRLAPPPPPSDCRVTCPLSNISCKEMDRCLTFWVKMSWKMNTGIKRSAHLE